MSQRTGPFSSRPRSSRSLFSLGSTTLLSAALLGAATLSVVVQSATASPQQPVAERTQQGSSGPQAFEERAVRVLEIPLGLDLYMPVPEGNPITPERIALGRRLFFDPRLSEDQSIACATCHDPQRAFTDGRLVARGVYRRQGTRNTPTLINRGYGKSQFLDGRAENLEQQVLEPILGANELGDALDLALGRLRDDAAYDHEFQEVFDRPLDASTLAQALAGYVRSILSGGSPVDRYRAGERGALSEKQIRGTRVFLGKGNCAACHVGPNFTDEEFHNTGVAWRPEVASESAASTNAFLDPGRFTVTARPRDLGAFKTPTLREVARTAPYMHDGNLATLEQVVDFYDRGGTPNPHLDAAIRPLRLTTEEKEALVAFLRALSGSVSDGG